MHLFGVSKKHTFNKKGIPLLMFFAFFIAIRFMISVISF